MIKVGILGLARREGTFAEVGLRSWEEAGCAAVEQALLAYAETPFVIHRPLVIRGARPEVEKILRDWCDVPNVEARCDLIFTVGGTGLTPMEIIPEATAAVVERSLPGISDLLRRHGPSDSAEFLPFLRGVAGLRGRVIIINLPGSAHGQASSENLVQAVEALLPLLALMIEAAQQEES